MMASVVNLVLVRHGETVDNVAQVYAGSTDSGLTNHGHQQATRLGLHLQSLGLTFTHFFSSHLQRAVKTAELIRAAQVSGVANSDTVNEVPDVVKLPILMEQDFGFYEGKKFYERQVGSKLTGKEAHCQQHRKDDEFVDMESKDSMGHRVDAFLDGHLLPIFESATATASHVVVVSHGIILSVLWKRLLSRLPPRSVSLTPELMGGTYGPSLEHLGGWSNTGFLWLHMTKSDVTQKCTATTGDSLHATLKRAPQKELDGLVKAGGATQRPSPSNLSDTATSELSPHSEGHLAAVKEARISAPKVALNWVTVIETVNGRDHLRGLKRTGGGVGSSRYDASQTKINSFFKRKKVD